MRNSSDFSREAVQAFSAAMWQFSAAKNKHKDGPEIVCTRSGVGPQGLNLCGFWSTCPRYHTFGWGLRDPPEVPKC